MQTLKLQEAAAEYKDAQKILSNEDSCCFARSINRKLLIIFSFPHWRNLAS